MLHWAKLTAMSAPTTIAHYRITGKLGEGGMGAVYRAADTKLNREVAIKVLPDALANDPDCLARFTSRLTSNWAVTGVRALNRGFGMPYSNLAPLLT
jgi:serine/threonine protein kinase